MAFRGLFTLDIPAPVGQADGRMRSYEIANSSRVVDHLRSTTPTADVVPGIAVVESPPGSGLYVPNSTTPPLGGGVYQVPPGIEQSPPGSGLYPIANTVDGTGFCECTFTVPYDDSWPGLRAFLTGGAETAPYRLSESPWYNPLNPQSAEFAGIWVMDVQGLDSTPVQRDISELLGDGGFAGMHRDTSRPVTFSALIVACTNAGARFGLAWLNTALRATRVPGGGTLGFLAAHPSGTVANPDELARSLHGVVLTDAPVVTETTGHGGGARHRQASVLRVDWEMVAANPYTYRPLGDSAGIGAPTTTEVPIEWVHQADCEDSASCDLPVLFAAGCEPERVVTVHAPIPVCGGCVPVCGVERAVWDLLAPLSTGNETAVTVNVHNFGADPLSLRLFWKHSDESVDDGCAQRFPLQINGLGAGMTAVADSITGRGVISMPAGQHRQAGIISTPSGAPWSSAILDTTEGWQLVAEGAPGQEYSVSVELSDRGA